MKHKTYIIKKIKYILDNRLHDGVFGLIKFLLLIVIFFVIIAVVLVCKILKFFDINETIFRVVPAVVNNWLPSFGDFDVKNQIPPLIVFTIIALFGVFFTSIFIGLITNSIEQRLMNIKDNHTDVYENGHIIILGFDINTYVLVSEIINGNKNRKICILIASNKSCDDMKNLLYSNVKVSHNVRIVFRTIDISNVEDLQKLSIKTSKRVIINLTTNFITLQILLSLNNLYKLENIKDVKIYALIYRDKHNFIKCINNENFVVLELNRIITKLIARSSNGHGIANIYRDIFNFDGYELYTEKIDYFVGKKFIDVINEIDKAIPIGLISNQKEIIYPDGNVIVDASDKIIMLEVNKNTFKILKENLFSCECNKIEINSNEKKKICSIIGKNEKIDLLKKEFNEYFIDCKYYEDREEIYQNDDKISKIAMESDSIVILNNHDADDRKKEDAYNIFIMKKFENYRDEHRLDYFITLEMSENVNKWHIEKEAGVDFIIASDLHSQLLAQISEKDELRGVFRELVGVEGCVFNEISVSSHESTEKYKVRDIRTMLYKKGYIFIGYYDKNIKKINYKANLDEELDITKGSLFIVISKNNCCNDSK